MQQAFLSFSAHRQLVNQKSHDDAHMAGTILFGSFRTIAIKRSQRQVTIHRICNMGQVKWSNVWFTKRFTIWCRARR